MSYDLRDKEYEAMLAAPGPTRYEYFVKRTADWDELWGLVVGDAWTQMVDSDSGEEMLALWPHARFASACASESGEEPRAISVSEWLDEWAPDLQGQKVAVFPDPDGGSVPVDVARLVDDLRSEIARFGD